MLYGTELSKTEEAGVPEQSRPQVEQPRDNCDKSSPLMEITKVIDMYAPFKVGDIVMTCATEFSPERNIRVIVPEFMCVSDIEFSRKEGFTIVCDGSSYFEYELRRVGHFSDFDLQALWKEMEGKKRKDKEPLKKPFKKPYKNKKQVNTRIDEDDDDL